MRIDCWTPEMDQALLDGIRCGLSVRGAGRAMGVPENAAIARHNRLRGVVFASDRARARAATARVKARRTELKQRDAEIARAIKVKLRAGEPRDSIIHSGRGLGWPFKPMAVALDLSEAYVWQILRKPLRS